MPSAPGAGAERDFGLGGFLADAFPALTLGGALLAGDFGQWTNIAAGALVAAAAIKIGVAQGLDSKPAERTPSKTPGLANALYPFACALMAAAMGCVVLAAFFANAPASIKIASVIFTIALVALGQDRETARPKIALLQAVFALVPVTLGLAVHWDRFAPIAVASVLGVAMALLQSARARLRKAAAAKASERQMASALDSMHQSFALFDASARLITGNHQFHRMFRTTEALAREIGLDDLMSKKLALRLKDREIIKVLTATGEKIPRSRQRESVMVDLADDRYMEFVFQPTAQGFSMLVEDVTSRRATEIRIASMAHQDDVTGLSNRSFCREKLEDAVERCQGSDTKFAVMAIDLDRFKQVNDFLGHPVGDKLLKRVAQRLKDLSGPEDVVARIGGDEFTVLHFGEIGGAAAFAAKIVETLSEPYHVDGAKLMIGASVGVTIAPDDGASAAELMKTADMALYAAKDAGRGAYRFFASAMAENARRKQQIEQDLRVGIGRNELEVWYQPIVSFSKRRICCCEALVRWRHPTQGMISPGEFIPVAEESGLIVQLGEWVLRRACMDAKSWPKDVRLAVNFSALQFTRSNVVDMVRRALQDTKFPATRLEMEITESVLMNDADSVLASIDELREMGMRVALDDFGTGYSSLGYLSRFRPDKVKIDQSFVRDMEKNAAALAIIKAVKALVVELGIDMLVEGVETLEQLKILRDNGADEAQGYLFSKPRPANEIARFVADPAQLVRGRKLLTENTAPWAKGYERVNPTAVQKLN